MAKNILDMRFGIKRTSDEYESSVWRLWVKPSGDIYLADRRLAGVMKYSFHKSGICRSAFTNEHGTPSTLTDRAMFKWKRSPTLLPGTGQASRLAWIAFPTNYLSRPHDHGNKEVTWISAAPSGQATYLELALTAESESSVVAALASRSERQLIRYLPLPLGDALIMLYYYDEWENKDIRSPAAEGSVFPDLVFSEKDPDDTGRPIRIIFGPPPKDGDALVLQELGGYPG